MFKITKFPLKVFAMSYSTRSGTLIAASGAALILTIWATLGVALYFARDSEIEAWHEQLDGTALLLAEQTAHEMGAADLLLDGLLERIRLLGVRDRDDLRARLGGHEEFERLRDQSRVVPQIDVISVVGADGQVINFTRSFPTPHINLAERDYFQAQRTRAELGLYVSAPVRNKGNGDWTFYLSRRISAPDGSFIGVVLVGISSRQISSFYNKIKLNGHSSVTLFRSDRVVLARWPADDTLLGSTASNLRSYQDIERQLSIAGTAVEDTVESVGGIGLARTLAAERVISNYPLMVKVAVPEQVFLEQWRYFIGQLGLVGGVCTLAVLAACATVWRSVRKLNLVLDEQRTLKIAADHANEVKSTFLAMMSHEIRTPLTAIIGFAEQLAQDARQETAGPASIIARNGEHLLRLMNDLLDMSKVESGKMVLEQVPFSPEEVLDTVSALMRDSARQRAITYAAGVRAPLPHQVLGDPTRWRQILLNLVSNAIKFTEEGAVDVTLWYDLEREVLYCSVRDTGIGMDPQQVGALFTPFNQADSTVARRFGGTGLGLYLVHQLANAMGGGVKVESRQGAGTTMTVSVLAPQAIAKEEAVPACADLALSRLAGRVLVVEDGAENRMLVRTLLESMGVEVLCAENGEQGVQCALATLPDLVLMDIHMPVQDGLTATAKLRHAGFKRPVVALTADVTMMDQERYLAAGFDDCLTKPINRAKFRRVVALHLPEAALAEHLSDLPGFAQLTRVFRDGIKQRVAKIAAALAVDDLAAVIYEAHSIKGSAATFGCPETGRFAEVLEAACRSSDKDAAATAFLMLEQASRLESAGT